MKKNRKIDTVFLALLGILSFFFPISRSDLSFDETASLKIYDRNGNLLREVLSLQQGKGHWIGWHEISSNAVDAAVVAEDKRFFSHFGIDPLALIRAAWQNISSGQVVSGGSTITQQVIRNLFHFPRNVFFKLIEMWYAVRLEYTLSKQEILEQYFNRIPFGNQTYGIEAAARLYLGKSAKELSLSEATFLMALPKSPTQYNPYKNSTSAHERRLFILSKLKESGKIAQGEWERATHESVVLFPVTSVFLAPHFCDQVIRSAGGRVGSVTTTLDLSLQTEVEKIINGQVNNLNAENVTNAAAIVIDNRSGDILAMAGSADYFDKDHDGQFNAVLAKRQPGSALKPFTYAAAMKKDLTAATIIPDMEISIQSKKATFTPHNYDNQFHGPVRARTALACSYNVSAVRVLQSLGVETLLSLLHACGIESLNETPEFYGHGLTLGNGEVTLFELTLAYSVLANGGKQIEPRWTTDVPVKTARESILSPQIGYLITSILSDNSARTPAFGFDSPLELPFPCAVKTGTSSDFRDNMTVGYTADYTVGVWAGNFDNSPMKEISGVTGAGPIFHDIMLRLYSDRGPTGFVKPPKVISKLICSFSGTLPHQGCNAVIEEFFIEGTEPRERCSFHLQDGTINFARLMPEYEPWLKNLKHQPTAELANSVSDSENTLLKIVHPRNKSVFKIDPNLRTSYQSLYFEATASGRVKDLQWYLNGHPYSASGNPYKVLWNLSKGAYRLVVIGRLGNRTLRDEITFEVIP